MSKALKNHQAFSLIELIIVMAIVGLIASLVPPLITKSIATLEIRSTVKNISSSLRYLKALAAAEKIPVSFNIDLEGKNYWLSKEVTTYESKVSSKVKFNYKKKILDDIEIKTYTLDKNNYSLFNGRDRIFKIIFSPNGNSTGGKITLKRIKEKKKYFEIYVDIFTGTVRYYEFPETRF